MTWRHHRADNPGPMTLDGTNTYVVGETGGELVVVDPGPEDAAHRAAVLELIGADHVTAIVLTHHHLDHSEGVPALSAELGGRIPVLSVEDGTLHDDEELPAGLRVLLTPGHTADSASLLLGSEAVLTGDTILGRGTSIISHPDGHLGAYLRSLQRLASLGAVTALPGHGPMLPDLSAVALAYLDHRQERLAQVRQALAAGARSPQEVVAVVYADVDRVLWPAAEASVRAQLDYLRDSENA